MDLTDPLGSGLSSYDVEADEARVRAAIDLLEPFATHPATGALHDPLYAWLSDRSPAHLAQWARAAARHPEHPAVEAMLFCLGMQPRAASLDLRQILAAAGPSTHDDPLVEVQARLRAAAEQRRFFEEQLQRRQAELDRLARGVDALSLVGALLAILALLGWLGALDVWTIDWIDPPVPANGDGVPLEKP